MGMESLIPENTDNTLYIRSGGVSLMNIIDEAESHFGGSVDFGRLIVTSLRFHARCLTYDLYDPSDYDDYIVVELV